MTERELRVKENIVRIRENITRAARATGREFSDIALVGASKLQPHEAIAACALCPELFAFGENRVQEFTEKARLFIYGNKPVHFIGHLQTNKAAQVVSHVALIQSIDSLRLMSAVSAQAEKMGVSQDVLIEINIGREDSKYGIMPDEIFPFFEQIGKYSGVFVRGIMAIPPKADTLCGNRRYFAKLYELFIDIKGKKYDNVSMDYLSMGMSEDYEDAVFEGANMVRIGSALFGQR